MNEEFESLLSDVCSNLASDEQLERLARLLKESPDARDDYLRYVDMHAALTDQVLPSVESEIIDYRSTLRGVAGVPRRPGVARRLISLPVAWMVTAAVLLLGVGFAVVSLRKSGSPQEARSSSPTITTIATLLYSQDCRWSEAQFSEGQQLLPGRMQLESGTAVLRFAGGAELILVGPTDIELETVGRARVSRGEVVVRAEDGAEGFMLVTPTSEIVDLGTEFAVRVGRSGATEVHVLEGEVAYSEPVSPGDLALILREGEAIASSAVGGKPRAVPMNSPRFAELVNRINPSPRLDLLTAYDGFNYTPGELPLLESTSGKGWAGPWRKRTDAEGANVDPDIGTNDSLQIVHGQMNVTWPVPGGRLGMLQLPAGKSFRVREMLHPIDLDRDGIYYFSLIVRESDLSKRQPDARPHESMRLTFRSDENYFGESLSFQISLRRNPQIQTGLGVGFASAAESSPDQTTLWIGKIVARQFGEDEVSFHVFAESDELTYVEPAVWQVVSRNLDLSAKLNLVLLTSTGLAPRIVDELRIGPTWRSVVPFRNTDN